MDTTIAPKMVQDQLTFVWQTEVFNAIIRGDDPSSMELLLLRGDINFKSPTWGTPLLYACKYDRQDIAQLLIDMGADVNETDNLKDTALYKAAQKGWLQVAKSLVEKGADLNFTGVFGQTPVFAACKFNKVDVLQFLLDSGADPNIQTRFHETALTIATQRGNRPAVEMLLCAGADVNMPCREGIPPLHQTRVLVIAEILIRAGADVNNTNPYYRSTPFSKFILADAGIYFLELCLEHGGYLHPIDYKVLLRNPDRVQDFLRNPRLCALAIANKFNYQELPALYKLEHKMVKRLPNVDKLKITTNSNAYEEIERAVVKNIEVNGHCMMPKVKPIVLSMLCIDPLIAFLNRPYYVKKDEVPQMVLRSSVKKEVVPRMVLRSVSKRVTTHVVSTTSKKSRRRR